MGVAGITTSEATALINTEGQSIRFRYFDTTFKAGSYDDDITLVRSGTDTWVSGLVQPLGQSEANLLQQGLLKRDDLKVYVDGTVVTSGTWKVGIGGSPPAGEYALAEDNMVDSPFVNGSLTYQKMFLRQIPTGSLSQE